MANTVNIDHVKAEEVILKAYRTKCQKCDDITAGIRRILNGSHKTYKYVLVTGILAKAVNSSANPLALQAGAPLAGAFDARSLCHKVLVPFERNFLDNVLGGSNEPFLNKPARFTHLSENNAVRKGNDKETLLLAIKLLESIKTSAQARAYLACVFEDLRDQIETKKSEFSGVSHYSPTLIEIYEFSLCLLKKSFEGETSAIIVASLEMLLHKYLKGEYKIIAHKVNQSGASSKEVGDIDIYNGAVFEGAIEVKDKDFTEHDIDHAFSKVVVAKGQKAGFIYGIRASFDKECVSKKVEEYEKAGACIVFQDITTHIRNILFRLPQCTKEEFVECIIETVRQVNCKDLTKSWLRQVFAELGWDANKIG
ncbi:MAG: restriction endonuclease, SacI family [Eubacteriales bacterium]|nr:restriction endonuclease, SacI family [Eubacteriales bacterium]